MITKIHIKNFKSIYDLEFEVGRVNLFIGENGSGKSNILEALVFVSASESNALGNEFLVPRGMRVPEPELMRSAFEEESKNKNIKVDLTFENDFLQEFEFQNENRAYARWVDIKDIKLIDEIEASLHPKLQKKFLDKITSLLIKNKKLKITLENFIIYSPENTALRNLYKDEGLEPLSSDGKGLLRLLKVIDNYEDKSYINTITESLELFGWFEDIKIPKDLPWGEKKLIIKDRYLYREFDQYSTNEGFLFILFYITLIVAKETPKAFAIDNIDASLNPKLCTKLMIILSKLAKKYDKQIFLTTHNPAILDGFDLNDENERLFRVFRNELGHTKLKRLTVEDNPIDEDRETLFLSEAFLRGYLGGLPKNI